MPPPDGNGSQGTLPSSLHVSVKVPLTQKLQPLLSETGLNNESPPTHQSKVYLSKSEGWVHRTPWPKLQEEGGEGQALTCSASTGHRPTKVSPFLAFCPISVNWGTSIYFPNFMANNCWATQTLPLKTKNSHSFIHSFILQIFIGHLRVPGTVPDLGDHCSSYEACILVEACAGYWVPSVCPARSSLTSLLRVMETHLCRLHQ